MEHNAPHDSLFDALFAQAVEENFRQEVILLQKEAKQAGPPVFSKSFEKRMEKLFRMEKRQKYAPFLRVSGRIAACIALVLSLAFGALMLSPEVRAVVFELFIEQFGGYRAFSSDAPAENVPNHLWVPSYIPDGYEIELEDYEIITTIMYVNKDEKSGKEGQLIHFGATDISNSLFLNSENVEMYTIDKNGITYYVSNATKADGTHNSLVWEIGRTRFSVSSLEPIDELLKIAESVVKK